MKVAHYLILFFLSLPSYAAVETFNLSNIVMDDFATACPVGDCSEAEVITPVDPSVNLTGFFTVTDNQITGWDVKLSGKFGTLIEFAPNTCPNIFDPCPTNLVSIDGNTLIFDRIFTPSSGGRLQLVLDRPVARGAQILPGSYLESRIVDGKVNITGGMLVPEPSTWAALLTGLAAVGVRWKRHG
jgi:hypothetical protein